MRRMEKVTGRTDDMMIVRGVNVFPTQIEERLLELQHLSAHYQIVLTRAGRMDEMEVKVEARRGAETAAQEDARLLAGRIKDTIGISATVSLLAPDGIERSQGKARRIIDLRQTGQG
jgi:phenylacetate-CoA ligase